MVKIIGGQWKRKNIFFYEQDGLRPSLGRVRETVFNWLGQDLRGKSCLDLFSGSGALGFESLSRGADSCIFVEKNKLVYETLKKNKLDLNAEKAEVVHSDAKEFLKNNALCFDVIFYDPPFNDKDNTALLDSLAIYLRQNGCIYLETRNRYSGPDYKIFKESHAGQVYFYLLTK